MAVNDLKFFTNEPERDLYGRFSTILKNNTQFFDILVGYFRTSGFFKLYSAMEAVEKIRVLVGLNVDKYTVDIIDQAEQLTLKEAKEEFRLEMAYAIEKHRCPRCEHDMKIEGNNWFCTGCDFKFKL